MELHWKYLNYCLTLFSISTVPATYAIYFFNVYPRQPKSRDLLNDVWERNTVVMDAFGHFARPDNWPLSAPVPSKGLSYKYKSVDF